MDKKMNWKELKAHIETMDEHQLVSDVTVHLTRTDEFIPVPAIDYTSEDDVLDAFHPYLIVDF